MLPGLCEYALDLHAEEVLLVLRINEWRNGGDTVAYLLGTVIPARLDGKHVHTDPACEAFVGIADSEIKLRDASILDVVRRSPGRTCGSILHLPDGCSGEGYAIRHLPVELDLRSTGERSERSSRVEREHVGHVGGHRMPGLTGGHLPVTLTDSGESLTETQLGGSGHSGDTAIEIGLDLTADLEPIELVAFNVNTNYIYCKR